MRRVPDERPGQLNEPTGDGMYGEVSTMTGEVVTDVRVRQVTVTP